MIFDYCFISFIFELFKNQCRFDCSILFLLNCISVVIVRERSRFHINTELFSMFSIDSDEKISFNEENYLFKLTQLKADLTCFKTVLVMTESFFSNVWYIYLILRSWYYFSASLCKVNLSRFRIFRAFPYILFWYIRETLSPC